MASIISNTAVTKSARRERAVFLAIVIWFATAFFSSARAQDLPAVEIDKIVITAPTATDSPLTPGASQDIRVDEKTSATVSVSELLGRTAGVHVLRHGGLEAATSISIRGGSPLHTEVYLDGIPLASAGGDGVGLERISADGLQRIEVFKLGAPARFGAEAVGGTVSLESRAPKRGFSHAYGLSYGSYNTVWAHAEAGHGGKKHGFKARADFSRSDGDFTFFDNNGTPLNPADDRWTERRNNESLTAHPSMLWKYRFDRATRLDVVSHFFHTASGVPGLENFQSVTAKRELAEWLGRIAFSRRLRADNLKFSNDVYWRVIRAEFSDPAGEIGLGAGQDNDNRTLIVGERARIGFSPARDLDIAVVGEFTAERFTPRDALSARPFGSTSLRRQVNAAVQVDDALFSERLKLTAQGRVMNVFSRVNNDDPSRADAGTYFDDRAEHPVSLSFAAVYRIVQELYLKAGIARAVRLPRFTEMFGDQGYVLGNPRLTAETSVKGDGGVVFIKRLNGALNELRAEASYYESRVDDLIQFEMNAGLARADNIGRAAVRGIETLVSARILRDFTITQGYVWQSAKDRAGNAGRFLVGRPEHELNAAIAFSHGPWRAAVRANFIDNQFLDALNTRKINSRLRADADVDYTFKKRVLVGVEARNLTNSQIVDAVGFPLSGRSFFGRVEVEF